MLSTYFSEFVPLGFRVRSFRSLLRPKAFLLALFGGPINILHDVMSVVPVLGTVRKL